ncbi:MAG: arylsulfatase [Terriglobia bacterium]
MSLVAASTPAAGELGTASAGSAQAAGAAAAPLRAATTAGRMSRPNILLLMSDQHRGDCIGADGNRAIHTPNLDAIARAGARFRQAYTPAPSCVPARAALLTGLSPWRNGLLGMDGWPIAPHYPVELPRAFHEAGYYTTGIGKMEFGPVRTDHGFHQMILDETSHAFRNDYDSWFWSNAPNLDPLNVGLGWNDYPAKPYPFPERLHHTHWTGETAVRFLRTYNRPEPFFLKVSFIPPHSPYTPPDRFLRQYADADLPKAVSGNWDSEFKPRSGPDLDIWHGDLGAAQVHQSRSGYYGQVSFVDEQIGRIIEALDQRGWLEETLILYTTDHGDMLGDHYLWRKCQPYQQDLRIPMLVRWPEGLVSAQRGLVFSQPVALEDVLPTLLDAASVPANSDLDGRSMLSLIRGNASGWRDVLQTEHDVCYSPRVHWNALTDGHVSYIFHAFDGQEQLFDLDRDPQELNDLAPDGAHAGAVRQWRERMVNYLEPRGDAYVKGGKLALRKERMPLSPNYPRAEVVQYLRQHGVWKYVY